MQQQSFSVDSFIGNKIKERRKKLNMSQTKLAEIMGLSYQQIQKYESGKNKITVNRIVELSQSLNISISYFYNGLEVEAEKIGKPINSNTISTTRTKPINILLVEDSPGDEVLAVKAMDRSGSGANVYTVRDSVHVMDYLRNHKNKFGQPRPDMIFMDINLPGQNGIDLLKIIKRDRELMNIPVIVLTNSISVKEMSEVYNLQAAGFIPKSFEFDEFSKNIKTAIEYWSKVVVLPNM